MRPTQTRSGATAVRRAIARVEIRFSEPVRKRFVGVKMLTGDTVRRGRQNYLCSLQHGFHASCGILSLRAMRVSRKVRTPSRCNAYRALHGQKHPQVKFDEFSKIEI